MSHNTMNVVHMSLFINPILNVKLKSIQFNLYSAFFSVHCQKAALHICKLLKILKKASYRKM